ncbi:hypothetical protein U0070_013738 [Myodes glareolus]|uniref:Uncharacterized protein n=1 Tax=Myodes glareolus TaxID=447135 RepID=A0AAW0I8S4_MYOGA
MCSLHRIRTMAEDGGPGLTSPAARVRKAFSVDRLFSRYAGCEVRR